MSNIKKTQQLIPYLISDAQNRIVRNPKFVLNNQQTTQMAATLAAGAAQMALPYVMQGISKGVQAIRTRRQARGTARTRRNRRSIRTTTKAPVSVGSTTSQRSAAIQRHSATEQFAPVAAGQSKFSVFTHSTEVLDELSFPRLSQMSGQYQNFTVNSLRYTFTPNIGTDTTGTIYLGFTPDVKTPLPTNAEDFKGLWGAVASNVWKPVTLTVPAAAFNPVTRNYYVRRTKSTDGDNFNSVGKFLYALEGTPVNTVLGYLSVSYDVQLKVPRTLIGASTMSGSLSISHDLQTVEPSPNSPLFPLDPEEPSVLTKRTRAPIVWLYADANGLNPIFETLEGPDPIITTKLDGALTIMMFPYGMGRYRITGGTFSEMAHNWLMTLVPSDDSWVSF